MKLKTNKQFLKDIESIHGNKIRILSKYKNSRMHIKAECMICKHIWFPLADVLMRKSGCPKCGKVYKRTHEEFIKEIKTLYGNEIIILGHYEKARIPVKVKNTICGHEWFRTPSNLFLNKDCPVCKLKKISHDRRKTHEQFMEILKTIHNDKIIMLDKYIGANNQINVKCKLCGYKWSVRSQTLLYGHGCVKCAHKINIEKLRKPHKKFVKELKIISDDKIETLSKYKGNHEYIKAHCLVCDHKWYVRPGNLLQGYKCPICSIKNRVHEPYKSNEEFIREIEKKHGNKIKILSEYNGALKPIKVECSICKYQWKPMPNNLIRALGCPKCNTSKGNKKISDWLDKNDINYEIEQKFKDCRNKLPLRFDFKIYIDEGLFFMLIEYDGEQHFNESKGSWPALEKIQKRDKIKDRWCKENNIELLRIPYWEYNNIEKILEKKLIEEGLCA